MSRRELDFDRFDEIAATGTVHHFSGFLDGRRVGFARAIDMQTGVALFGGRLRGWERRRAGRSTNGTAGRAET